MIPRFWTRKRETSEAQSPAQPGSVLATPVTHRQFLKVLVAAAGGAAVGLVAGGPERVRATYVDGTPADTVDRNLNVQGDLIVTSGSYGPGNVGIGTATPQGKLDVAGEIRVNGAVAVDASGVVQKTYYAP